MSARTGMSRLTVLGAVIGLALMAGPAFAQEMPPSDMELMQRQTIAAIAEVNYLRGLVARREAEATADKAAAEAQKATLIEWLKAAQAEAAPKS